MQKPLLLLVLFSTLGVSLVLAQGRPKGLRLTVTAIDPETATVDFDVTLNTTSPFTGSPTGMLGSYLFTTWFNYTGYLKTPRIPAVEYGDGEVIDRMLMAPVESAGGMTTYRASFRHTYPEPGRYELRVGSANLAVGRADTYAPFSTGRAVTASSFSYSVYSPFLRRTTIFATNLTYPVVAGITNTPGSNTPWGGQLNGGGDLVIPTPPSETPAEDVPIGGTAVRLLLASILGLFGWWLLR
ncbi:MAG: hypothetical protein R3234_02920 [Thermoanaerobaculia bacterium]|nr:hypothetical protein [Thermoanaerobaculia bacterium]